VLNNEEVTFSSRFAVKIHQQCLQTASVADPLTGLRLAPHYRTKSLAIDPHVETTGSAADSERLISRCSQLGLHVYCSLLLSAVSQWEAACTVWIRFELRPHGL